MPKKILSDEQIIQTIYEISCKLHEYKTGFWGLVDDYLDEKYPEYKKAEKSEKIKLRSKLLKQDKEILILRDKKLAEIAAKYGLENTNTNEQKFRLQGKDLIDNRVYFSCGNAAKAFCEINRRLGNPLDIKIMLSTRKDHLIDGMIGHTLPCIKMNDGKYHAVDPQIAPGSRENNKYGFEFIKEDIVKGGIVHHLLKSTNLIGYDFIITDIVSVEEHEDPKKLSNFHNFIKRSTIIDKKTQFILSSLSMVKIDYSDSNKYQESLYNVCKTAFNNKLPVKICVLKQGQKFPVIDVKGELFEIRQNQKLRKLNETDVIDKLLSASDYIKQYKQNIIISKKNNNEK